MSFKLVKARTWAAVTALLGGLSPLASSAQPANCAAETISVHCGTTPSVTWHNGTFWTAFAQQDRIYLTTTINGDSYSQPVAVNSQPETIDSNGENRPKIVFSDGTALVSWTQKTSARYTGAVRYSRSTDGGKSFSAPRTIGDDAQVSQRFDQLHVSPDGTVYLAWLAKVPPASTDQTTGSDATATVSALYYAVSNNQGESFSPGYRVAASTCECCRLASATANDGVAVLWRHIFGDNIRDHALAIVTRSGKTRHLGRATLDNWHIEACPHHGPHMAAAAEGFHLGWFTNGDEPGIHYGRYRPQSGTTEHHTLIDDAASASHPQVQESNGTVYFVWKRFDGERTSVQLRTSNDGGVSWSEGEAVAATAGASDHPQLVIAKSEIYLAWHTQQEGLRLLALPGGNR